MEPEPSTSLFKTKRKMSHFSESEKVMIINMLQYVKETWPADKYASKNEMKDRTAHILGISKSAVYRILKNYTETDMVNAAASPKKRPSLIDRIDDFDKSCIRRIVHNFYFKGELPTAKKVLRVIHSDESLPNMGMTSLRKLLKHMKFKYVKRRSINALIESNDIALWRINYLNGMKTYRQQQRPIYYVVETWVNAENTLGKVWEDTTVSKCAKNPTSKDNRLIVLHIGGEKGFVPQSELVFECHHTDDYQEFMKPDMFENWFQAMLPRLDPNSVVVMDNASYNSRRKEKIPVTSWKKHDIHEWLSSKQISFDTNETKIELLEKVNVVKTQYQSYVVDEMAEAFGVEVLRLPPYHCELNPIELVWADVKRYVGGKNTFEITDVKRLLMEALGNISAEKWQNCISHVKQEEIKLSSLDAIVDKTVDSFVMDVDCESSENSYSDSEGSDLDF